MAKMASPKLKSHSVAAFALSEAMALAAVPNVAVGLPKPGLDEVALEFLLTGSQLLDAPPANQLAGKTPRANVALSWLWSERTRGLLESTLGIQSPLAATASTISSTSINYSPTALTLMGPPSPALITNMNAAPRTAFGPYGVHEHLVKGLPGSAALISASLAFDTLADAAQLWHLSEKTLRKRTETELLPAEGEIAQRLAKISLAATQLFCSADYAREWLRTENYALGGRKPLDLLETSSGERIVLAALDSQAGLGPV